MVKEKKNTKSHASEEDENLSHDEPGKRDTDDTSENLDVISRVIDEMEDMDPVQYLVQKSPTEKIEKKAQKYLQQQKDYGKYEPVKLDYSLFLQLPNACGLSAVLMLVDPLQNETIAKNLSFIWDHVKSISIIVQERKEFQWAYALEYLLLKSSTKNDLFNYIHSLEGIDYYFISLEAVLRRLQQEHQEKGRDFIVNAYEDFFTKGIINQFLLSQHINLYKHNPEIQILMAILGYEFVKQPSIDGTGALFFTEEELKDLQFSSSRKKLNKLRSEYLKGARIICGTTFHWVVVTKIFSIQDKVQISMNDPSGKRYNVNAQELSDKDRFYIFRKSNSTPKNLWTQIMNILKLDGPKEVTIFNRIKDEIQKRIESQSHDDLTSAINSLNTKIQVQTKDKKGEIASTVSDIPLKIHEDTVKSIKKSHTQESSSKTGEMSDKQKPESTDMSSKEAFMKKMREIIGDCFQDYESL